jgi:pyrroloquinoline quinone (PQQ) biosynthesis protein C
MGRAHVTEQDLRERDESLLVPGAKAAFYAWLYCAREKPWLEGLVYSHILERRNNNAVVKGGGLSERWKRKQQTELGLQEAAKDFQTTVHAVADEAHSDLFEPIFTRYVDSKSQAEAVLAAAGDCLVIDRAFRGALADALAATD